DEVDLGVAQAAHVGELAVAGHGLPRRHVTAAYHVADVVAARIGLAIARQRERSNLAGAMADLAVRLKDPLYLIVEGDRRGRGEPCEGSPPNRRGPCEGSPPNRRRLAGGGEQDQGEQRAAHPPSITRTLSQSPTALNSPTSALSVKTPRIPVVGTSGATV